MDKATHLLTKLPDMPLDQVKAEWRRLFHNEGTGTMSLQLMRLAIAYKIQELSLGATGRCNVLRQKAAVQPHYPEECGFGHAQKMRPGTRLLREYKGKTHEVIAVKRGRFVYDGQVFRSLSEIARLIVGRPRAGTMFFGLKGRKWGTLED